MPSHCRSMRPLPPLTDRCASAKPQLQRRCSSGFPTPSGSHLPAWRGHVRCRTWSCRTRNGRHGQLGEAAAATLGQPCWGVSSRKDVADVADTALCRGVGSPRLTAAVARKSGGGCDAPSHARGRPAQSQAPWIRAAGSGQPSGSSGVGPTIHFLQVPLDRGRRIAG
jgi:hypothetical protein